MFFGPSLLVFGHPLEQRRLQTSKFELHSAKGSIGIGFGIGVGIPALSGVLWPTLVEPLPLIDVRLSFLFRRQRLSKPFVVRRISLIVRQRRLFCALHLAAYLPGE